MNIDWKELKDALTKWLVEQTISRLDAETIQKLLQFGVDWLKQLAAETSTPIDDWAVSQLEAWIQDQAKIEQIRAFITEKLQHLCADAEGDEYQILTDSLLGIKPGETGGPITNAILTKILATLIETLIQYFTEKDQ